MLPLDILLSFSATAVLLALMPGPDNLFVMTQSALYGRRAGMRVVLGLCTGLIVHTLAVACGVAVLFQTSALAFSVLKIIGALYLLYLAYHAFRASGVTTAAADNADTAPTVRNLYLRGVVMNITNPKVSIFFLAFLPQFARPDAGNLAGQLVLLGVLFMASTLVVFGLISYLAGALGGWLARSARAQRILNRIAGVVFVALAAKLLTARQ
jgi:threonine/homoserine/homoserine lactone efflux protein